MEKLKVLDLFSGIGGFSLGLERTGGFETVAFCEIEEFPRKVLRKHWPDVPIYEDVRTLEHDGPVDVVCGGFPCQDISLAGRGAGIEGERSGLWVEMARIIGLVSPRYVIVENVAALLGRGLGTVLGDLAALGYDAEWHCVPASCVGAIQNRDRIWIVAYPCENGKQGLFSRLDTGKPRQGWACGPQDLQQIFAEPLKGDVWPQPLICGSDNRPADWVDRIGALGNAVVPQIPEMIGYAILDAEK